LGQERGDRVEAVLEDGLEDEVLAPARVLRVVHRAHVQRGHVGPQSPQVGEALLDRDADRAGGVVDDHVVELGPDRLGDRPEVLDLVRGGAVRRPRVYVDLGRSLVDRPAGLGRVLLRGVGDRGALVAVGDRARDRVADDHRVLEAAHCPSSRLGDARRTVSSRLSTSPRFSSSVSLMMIVCWIWLTVWITYWFLSCSMLVIWRTCTRSASRPPNTSRTRPSKETTATVSSISIG